jgi:hypothetical protein
MQEQREPNPGNLARVLELADVTIKVTAVFFPIASQDQGNAQDSPSVTGQYSN